MATETKPDVADVLRKILNGEGEARCPDCGGWDTELTFDSGRFCQYQCLNCENVWTEIADFEDEDTESADASTAV